MMLCPARVAIQLRLALLLRTSVLVMIVDEVGAQKAVTTWALNLMFGVLIKSTLTLINLILHEFVDPEAHLNVIL